MQLVCAFTTHTHTHILFVAVVVFADCLLIRNAFDVRMMKICGFSTAASAATWFRRNEQLKNFSPLFANWNLDNGWNFRDLKLGINFWHIQTTRVSIKLSSEVLNCLKLSIIILLTILFSCEKFYCIKLKIKYAATFKILKIYNCFYDFCNI